MIYLAVLGAESVGAEARVLSDAVEAGAAVLARVHGAVVRVGQTVASFVSFGAEAGVGSVRVAAGGSVAAGRGDGALVDVLVAQAAGVSQLARAGEIHVVAGRSALGSVAAPVGSAGIQFGVAVASRVGQLAHALVVVDQVDAGSSVTAGIRGAVVHIHLNPVRISRENEEGPEGGGWGLGHRSTTTYIAVAARVSLGAGARVVVEGVLAQSSVLARIRLALVDVELAALAAVSGGAVADELADAVLAGSSVEAGIALALVDVAEAARVKVAARAVALESVDQIRTFT